MFSKNMFYGKLRFHLLKSLQFIIWLSVLIFTYNIAIYISNAKVLKYCFPKHLDKYLFIEEDVAQSDFSSDVTVLAAKIETLNTRHDVMHVQEFGPVSTDTPFMVVTVHRELPRLQQLVAALAGVAGVDDLLLIFSHTHYDDMINRLIQQIDYCMVMQIFYPHSVQLNPASFPGYDPDDFFYETGNDSQPRDPRLTEPKHHWWWTASFVFDHLVWPEPHTDMVIFIDESSYVLPDLMFVLSSAKYAMSFFPEVHLISLGRSPPSTAADYGLLTLNIWRPAYGNGLAFNRSMWERISALGYKYCEYDDISWSASLQYLFRQMPGGRAVAMAVVAPRVLPAAAFPHGRVDLCRLTQHRLLFPHRVHAVVPYTRTGRVLEAPELATGGRGGWSHRDMLHCYELIMPEENFGAPFLEAD